MESKLLEVYKLENQKNCDLAEIAIKVVSALKKFKVRIYSKQFDWKAF